MAHILMILASERFRDIEYIVPRAFFEQRGFRVSTASSVITSKGRFGFEVRNSLLIEEVHVTDYDGIYFVGGAGAAEFKNNEKARLLAEAFFISEKPVAAICAAPRNLLYWGLLKGKKATGHNGDGQFSGLALEYGAIPVPEATVVYDSGILTASGPEASEESALEFMKLFENK